MERKAKVKTWLAENGHSEVLEMIETQEKAWAEQGKKTRRNWWDVLAGGKNGKPRVIGGVSFPVLESAQKRMKRDLTATAVDQPAAAPEKPARIVEAATEAAPEPVLEAAPEVVSAPAPADVPEFLQRQ